MRQNRKILTGVVFAIALALALSAAPAGATTGTTSTSPPMERGVLAGSLSAEDAPWEWPLTPPYRLVHPFQPPPHAYGAGHRGLDIAPARGRAVRAPADGVVAFAGTVVDRGVVTIDHGGGLVSTLEPVSPVVTAGDRVARTDVVASLSTGGHTEPGLLHLGARIDGEYVDPLTLLGGIPRAVLLPLG